MSASRPRRAFRSRSGATRWLALGVALHAACAAAPPHAESTAPPPSVAVYALSRGKGVPDATRKTLGEARALLEELQRAGRVTRLDQSRIGLEGETRLCAEFKDTDTAHETIERLRALARGVELFNVVEEPCRKGD